MHDDRGTAEDEVLDPATVWETIKDVNPNDNASTFFIVFKYYTVVGEGLTPAPWQQYDHRPADKKAPDHINITECSSILALALEGEPVSKVPLRRGRRSSKLGAVYDTFAPYHLLNIQCFPDHIHAENESIRKPCYYNGPYVFLNRLVAEYKDATKRYLRLNDRIEKLITPPNQFMFDVKLRDKLLFEDADFTFSRRYFWAYNSLGVINDGIKSMISAYTDTFTPEFWAGRDRTLWPHPDPDSAEARNYLAQLGTLRQELELVIEDLKQVFKANELVRQEIVSLREQLFSGSSVKESRRAIEQGDNIKILTGVSMLFLPLTFVTSVFGITEFTFSANDWRFPVTMVGVCVPFFLLIFVLQTRAGMRAVRQIGDFIEGNMGRWSDRSRSRHERRLQLQQQLQQAAESQTTVVGGRRRMSLRRGPKRRKASTAGLPTNGVINGVSVPAQQRGKWWESGMEFWLMELS
ncbi:putative gtpase-activator protein for ras-like gtpase containing protein [Diaporthe ampelina]|uniref:Putative gtpase-activator protein for ras-like gtpase containing protein n=1 Tax=Diaporthe ampelina TaxID=1214573 RepID=A0A0G2F9V0_9PEZI|nr:putative gtpase-activator protein for ras-like gtpase containing protein [Diaporthe ampelina]